MSATVPADPAMRARSHLLILVLGLVVATPAAAATAPQELRVVAVPGLELSDLAGLADRAAVGLLVPGAGPRVSQEAALAGLERGVARNSLRGGLPEGPALIEVETLSSLPDVQERTIVLGIPRGGDQANDLRYPIAVVAPGFAGLFESERTRIPGLVSVADVAPTALGEPSGLGSSPSADPLRELRELDARIEANGHSRPIAALVAGALILALALVFPRAAMIGFATAVLANLLLGVADASALWLVALVVAIAVAGVAPVLALVARSPLAVALVLVLAVTAYLVALGLDGEAVALSPLGPTQNSRFYGLSNLLSAMLLVPALGGAALLRVSAGWLPAIVFAGASLVTVAGSRFGADGGTAIVLCVAYGLLAVELAEARRRAVAVAVAVAAAAVAALLVIDAVSGSSSHLTDAIGGGPGGLADDLRDRIVLSWERATEHWYLAVLVALAAVVLLLLAARLVLSGLPRSVRALPIALAVAVAVSLLVNDSPLDVVSMGLVGFIAAQRLALVEPQLLGGPD
jgi:hypothetical protein